jgi:transposase-like protein
METFSRRDYFTLRKMVSKICFELQESRRNNHGKRAFCRSVKYLNNIVEQDHRFPKKLAKYKSYFQYFHTAWRTLRGDEIMNAIRKGQVQNIAKDDILGQRDFIHSLFRIAV